MTYDARNLTPDGKRIVESQQALREQRARAREREREREGGGGPEDRRRAGPLATWVIGDDRGSRCQ